MRSKIIIPRKDHEVYFIMPPEGIKLSDAQNMIYDRLGELHPGFTAATRIDIKTFEFNKTIWFMVTVMAGETIAEYQIIHKNAILYTNTSIIANTKNFIINAPEKIDDELIGFDNKKNEPVSIPVESAGISNNQVLAGDLKKIPSRYSVFNKKKPKWIIAAAVFLLLFIFLQLIYTSIKIPKNSLEVSAQFENIINEKTLIPPAFAILANIAELFLTENGEIERWQYNLTSNPEVTIQCNGISALTAATIFGHVKYLTLDDIQIINYIDRKPATTIFLKARHDIYSIPASNVFINQENIYIAAGELTELLTNQNILINSEIYPSAGNGYMMYTISYIADERMLVTSMNIIEVICSKYQLFVRNLDITASSERRTFTVTCAFSYSETLNETLFVPNNKKQIIPLVFGYYPVRHISNSATKEQIPERASLIGTIQDSYNQTVFYHDSEGKIKSRSIW